MKYKCERIPQVAKHNSFAIMKLQTLLAFTTAAFAGLGSAQQWKGTYHINDINPDLKVVCNVGTPLEGKDNSCLVDGLK